MAFVKPTIQQFVQYFYRDFPYGTDPNTSVLDQDINSAFMSTDFNINPALFSNQQNYNLGYLLLSAHFLVMNLRASSQGINGQFNWLQVSKGAGPVSESFSIPQRILDNPLLSVYTKTNYGMAFLQLILPQLAGQMFTAIGTTLP